jgi:hypothetical protein
MVLQLEQFQPLGGVLRGGHELQLVVLVGQQHPDRRGTDEVGRPDGEHVQEVAQVEVIGAGVGCLAEDLRQSSGGQGRHDGYRPAR